MKISCKIILTASLLFLCLTANADNTVKVKVALTIDSTEVMAESLSFGRRIDGAIVKPELDYMLLKFRETTKNGKWLQNKGDIGAFSL